MGEPHSPLGTRPLDPGLTSSPPRDLSLPSTSSSHVLAFRGSQQSDPTLSLPLGASEGFPHPQLPPAPGHLCELALGHQPVLSHSELDEVFLGALPTLATPQGPGAAVCPLEAPAGAWGASPQVPSAPELLLARLSVLL